MTEFWSEWIVILTMIGLLSCYGLVGWFVQRAPDDNNHHDPVNKCQSWEDVRAYQHPVPGWWLFLFYISVPLTLIYFYLYPALGKLPGTLKWTSQGQYVQERSQYNALYAKKFNQYLMRPITEVAQDPEAMKIGKRLFVTYCSNCHQPNGKEINVHYPNLADKDWLWGGEPEQIETTIIKGRTGIMPAWGIILGEKGTQEIASYVMTLSNRWPAVESNIPIGKEKFARYCQFCHGPDGKGDTRIGAPNLTDQIWLHIDPEDIAVDAKLEEGIRKIVANGFKNSMPPHWKMLDKPRIHLLTSYIYSLSN